MYWRDWSSDVCSSDLKVSGQTPLKTQGRKLLPLAVTLARRFIRSEERRVGKECRSRWFLHDVKQLKVIDEVVIGFAHTEHHRRGAAHAKLVRSVMHVD